MRDTYYILDGKTPVVASLMVWAERFELSDRILKQEYYQRHGERIFVSTVFLGLDHRYFGDGPPLLFEIMVFNGHPEQMMILGREKHIKAELQCRRWSSWDEAMAGHEMVMHLAKVDILGCRPKT